MRPLNSIVSLAISISTAILPLEMNGSGAPSPSKLSRRGRRGITRGRTLAAIARDSVISVLHQNRHDRHGDQQRDDGEYHDQCAPILYASILAGYQFRRHRYTLSSTITSSTNGR